MYLPVYVYLFNHFRFLVAVTLNHFSSIFLSIYLPIYQLSAYHSGVMVYALWAGSSSTVPRNGTRATVSEPECCVHAHEYECAWCVGVV